jgi:hypothetical protein
MAQGLGVVAGMFGQTPETLPWADLRYQHTQAIRAKLAETRAPAGVNKILAAVRGVLREAWRLGLIDAEEYERSADIKSVRGEQLPTPLTARSWRSMHGWWRAAPSRGHCSGRPTAGDGRW